MRSLRIASRVPLSLFVACWLWTPQANGILAAEAQTAAPPPVVKLLDAGSGAKTTLRFAPKKGATQTVIMSLKMEMSVDMGGFPMPKQKLPTQELTVEVKVDDVAANGDITYSYKYANVNVKEEEGVQPMVMSALKAQLEGLQGLSGSSTVTNRGVAKSVKVDLPDTVTPQARQMLESMKQSMEQFSVPVPEEAVGVGAKWDVTSALEQNSVKIRQVSSYEVVSIEGSTVNLKVAAKQNSKDQQEMKAAGMPPGAKLTLISLESKGTGSTVLDLGGILPKDAKLGVVNDTKMEMKTGDDERVMSTHMEMQMTMKESS